MKLLNVDQIKTIFEIDKTGELFNRLLSIFKTDISKHIIELESYITNAQYENAKKTSHSIKSSSLNIGAAELAIIAGELESWSVANQDFNLEKVAQLQKCFEQTVNELKNEGQKLGKSISS